MFSDKTLFSHFRLLSHISLHPLSSICISIKRVQTGVKPLLFVELLHACTGVIESSLPGHWQHFVGGGEWEGGGGNWFSVGFL